VADTSYGEYLHDDRDPPGDPIPLPDPGWPADAISCSNRLELGCPNYCRPPYTRCAGCNGVWDRLRLGFIGQDEVDLDEEEDILWGMAIDG
jgi:hypothetical protein